MMDESEKVAGEKMKAYIMMNRRTGDLFEAYRVSLMDANSFETEGVHWEIQLSVIKQHGWVVYHPKLVVPHFFNMKCEEFFMVLGEL